MNGTMGWWTTTLATPLAGLLGTILLAFVGSGADWTSGWLGTEGPTLALIIGGALSAAALIVHLIIAELRQSRLKSRFIDLINMTLTPTAKLLMKRLASSNPEQEDSDLMSRIMVDLRSFVGDQGVGADANYYRISGGTGGLGTTLTRVNETIKDARPSFTRTKAQDPNSREAAAVIDRICNRQSVLCENVHDGKSTQKWTINTERKRGYEAFLSVPVSDDDSVHGMLSVNTRRRNGIEVHHKAYIEGVARLLAQYEQVRK